MERAQPLGTLRPSERERPVGGFDPLCRDLCETCYVIMIRWSHILNISR